MCNSLVLNVQNCFRFGELETIKLCQIANTVEKKSCQRKSNGQCGRMMVGNRLRLAHSIQDRGNGQCGYFNTHFPFRCPQAKFSQFPNNRHCVEDVYKMHEKVKHYFINIINDYVQYECCNRNRQFRIVASSQHLSLIFFHFLFYLFLLSTFYKIFFSEQVYHIQLTHNFFLNFTVPTLAHKADYGTEFFQNLGM